ncbi:EIF3C [Cordylochernes scorpioides]|uniref:EIF3C n=1 Tax=Cordylochernes scorpioides TaxID=51811 RepID=A0ABY6LFM4_9ARAC|nr:EIF3C [Cordylochernes scorpioides]
MSRFFNCDSSSGSSSSDSEEDIPVQKNVYSAFELNDEEVEDKQRIVRTAKEKCHEELEKVTNSLDSLCKNRDIGKLSSNFDNLIKIFTKSKPLFEKNGNKIPKFLIRTLVNLEEMVNNLWNDKDAKKKLSKANSKLLVSLRLKLKKFLVGLEEEIEKYKENPDISEEEDTNEVQEEEKSEVEQSEEEEEVVNERHSDSNDESESEEKEENAWDADWDSEEEEEEVEVKAEVNMAAMFIKKDTEETNAAIKKKRERKTVKKFEVKEEEEEDELEQVEEPKSVVSTNKNIFQKGEEVTHKSVMTKLKAILTYRGRKGAVKEIEHLQMLRKASELKKLGPGIDFKITSSILTFILDYSFANMNHLGQSMEAVSSCLDILEANPDLTIGQQIEEEESLEEPPYKVDYCLLSSVEKIDKEFLKILRENDDLYEKEVLKKDQNILEFIIRLEKYLEKSGTPGEICRIYFLHLDHIYYKKDEEAVVDRLVKYINKHETKIDVRIDSMLMHIYNLALNDKLVEAWSQLRLITIPKPETSQILYNRALSQLGLCSFRLGKYQEAHDFLNELHASGHVKELLAQGYQRNDSEKEKQMKKHLLPFYKRINLEVLECAYLVSAMLIEIPNVARVENRMGHKPAISRGLYHHLRTLERMVAFIPPETMREHVVAAAVEIRYGKWKKAKDFIINEEMNSRVWKHFPEQEKLLDMVTAKIKESCLRCYIHQYVYGFRPNSVNFLSRKFEIDSLPICYDLILKEQLPAVLEDGDDDVYLKVLPNWTKTTELLNRYADTVLSIESPANVETDED